MLPGIHEYPLSLYYFIIVLIYLMFILGPLDNWVDGTISREFRKDGRATPCAAQKYKKWTAFPANSIKVPKELIHTSGLVRFWIFFKYAIIFT